MWKRAFVILVSINLLVFAVGVAWLTSFPRASESPQPPAPIAVSPGSANVQLSIGQDAINTYLQYALSEQLDVQRVLSYAEVDFSNVWDCDLGIKLADRVVPFQLEFTPIIQNGNLDLQVTSASMGDLPIPVSLLFLVLRHLAWPNWIQLDPNGHLIDLNFTDRPQRPYGIHIDSYSPQTELLTLTVTIVPKAILTH